MPCCTASVRAWALAGFPSTADRSKCQRSSEGRERLGIVMNIVFYLADLLRSQGLRNPQEFRNHTLRLLRVIKGVCVQMRDHNFSAIDDLCSVTSQLNF